MIFEANRDGGKGNKKLYSHGASVKIIFYQEMEKKE